MQLKIAAIVLMVTGLAAAPAYPQRAVEPNELKINPAGYRNSSIVLRDVFINRRSGIPPALTAAGYTSQKYISFGCRGAGIWCFLRRDSVNEKTIASLKNGDRVTVYGTVRQPKAKVERAGGRVTDRYKLDIYLIEADRVVKGWD